MRIDVIKSEIYDILVDFIPGSDDVATATNKIMALVNKQINDPATAK